MKQRNISWIGPLVDSLYTSLPVLSIINFLSIITVLYTTIQENLMPWAPWLRFWMFATGMCVLVIIMMVLIYKFVLPSLWTFRNNQMHGYESVLMKEVQQLQDEVSQLRNAIEEQGGQVPVGKFVGVELSVTKAGKE